MPPGYNKIKKKQKPPKDYPKAKRVTDPAGETIKGAGGQDILVPKDDYIVEYEQDRFYPVKKNVFEATYDFENP